MTRTPKQRLLNQIHGQAVDRIPMIGGWNLGVGNLAALAGITIEEYLKNPFRGVVRANQVLQVDAVVPPIVPTDTAAIRDGSLQDTEGGRGMLLFTSNVTGVEVPSENIVAAYRYLSRYEPGQPRPKATLPRLWPGYRVTAGTAQLETTRQRTRP